MIGGRSLELYFVDGRPDGLLTAEVFNWTGHVIRTPRTQIKDALSLHGANHTGVYVLLGQTEDGPLAYIGEAEDIGDRLRQHVSGKDWWDTAVMITTSADALHKAHVKYLESRLVEIARDVGRAPLENGNTPARSSLNPAAVANMESFLDVLNMVLPAIGVELFVDKKRPAAPALTTEHSPKAAPVFEMTLPRHDIKARARLEKGEMIVLGGSQARTSWIGDRTEKTSYWKLYDKLTENGDIQIYGEHAVFLEDYAFSSPSAASAVIAGRSDNGRTSWKHEITGQTFAEWEADQLNQPNTAS
jgi:hypothetical protein